MDNELWKNKKETNKIDGYKYNLLEIWKMKHSHVTKPQQMG